MNSQNELYSSTFEYENSTVINTSSQAAYFDEIGADLGVNVGLATESSAYETSTLSETVYSSGAAASNTVNQVTSDLLTLNLGGGSLGGVSSAALGSSSNLAVSGDRKAVSYGVSEVEAAILRAAQPIVLNETEEITVNGQRGIWANKAEVINWRGPISINQYQINQDVNPEIVRKQTNQSLTYIQELAVRYLRPPTPPAPGEIVITQQANTVLPPAPPVVIRQQPPRPTTPQPLVIREAPPQAPARVGRKIISISGKTIPPPPRKVVIERLAPLPNKPQAVFVERWLPYSQVKRRVIFQKSNQVDPVVVKPRNVIIQWEAPKVEVRKEIKNLGVIRANPVEYVQRYSSSLRVATELPQFVLDIKPPQGVVLAANYRYNTLHELYGDVQALNLINLEREGLGAYRDYLARVGISANAVNSGVNIDTYSTSLSSNLATYSTSIGSSSIQSLIDEIFSSIDQDSNGRVSIEEAQKVLLRLNSRLGRSYGEDDINAFFASLDINQDGQIDFMEFRRAFDSLLS